MTKTCAAFKLMLVRDKGESAWDARQYIIDGPISIAKFFKEQFSSLDREQFTVLALDSRNHPIAWNVVSVGSLSASIVHPREVFKFAVLANAANIILLHNHPSGDSTPSRDDTELTGRLVKAGQLMGIEVLDHLIFGDETISLKEKGLM